MSPDSIANRRWDLGLGDVEPGEPDHQGDQEHHPTLPGERDVGREQGRSEAARHALSEPIALGFLGGDEDVVEAG
jgi:hypothetical protein